MHTVISPLKVLVAQCPSGQRDRLGGARALCFLCSRQAITAFSLVLPYPPGLCMPSNALPSFRVLDLTVRFATENSK